MTLNKLIMSAILSLAICSLALSQTVVKTDNKPSAPKVEDATIAVTSAQLVCTSKKDFRLQVSIDKSADSFGTPPEASGLETLIKAIKNPDSYYVIELATGKKFNLSKVTPENTALSGNILWFDIVKVAGEGAPVFAPSAAKYGLIANLGSLSKGNFTAGTTMTVLSATDSCLFATMPDKLAAPSPPKVTKGENKLLAALTPRKPDIDGDPVVVFNLDLNGVKRKKRFLDFDFNFRPYRHTRLRAAGRYDISAYVKGDFLTDADGKYTSRKVDFGVEFDYLRVFHDDGDQLKGESDPRRTFIGLNLIVQPHFETTWFFRSANFITNVRTKLPINVHHNRHLSVRIDPYIGFEGGKNLRGYRFKIFDEDPDELPAAVKEGYWIARPLFGAELSAIIRHKEKPAVLVDISYIRRFFLNKEISAGLDDEGKEYTTESRLPRDLVTSKFTFNTPWVLAPFVEYKYGRDTPDYTLVNHRYKLGLAVSFDWLWKKHR